jgi:hypothetical protein
MAHPGASVEQVPEGYRLHWQVELTFSRLKLKAQMMPLH